MDVDSFLNLLSPGLNEMDVDWGSHSSDADFYVEHARVLAWVSDGFLTKGVGEDDADAPSHGSAALNSIMNRRIAVDNASAYSSVLKVSDIASALHNFSRAAGMVDSSHAHTQKSLPPRNCSSVPQRSCSPQDLTSSVVSGVDALHSSSFSALTMNHSSNKVSNELKAREMELSSEISSEDNGCEHSDDKNDGIDIDTDDEFEYAAEDEDLKPPVSHVRIIRRPNSNCGQGVMLPPKRMKFPRVKVEVASSCEMASTSQEDKEGGAYNLKQMRKEGMSQRDVHVLSERQRRESMRESFGILQSLLPNLKLRRTDRITVLTEVIAYIQTLRGTLEELGRKKADILNLLAISSKTKPRRHPATITYVNTSNNSSSDDKAEGSSGWCTLQNGELVAMVEVTVRMCGADVFITLNTPRHKGVWCGVLSLLHQYNVEISNATFASSGGSSFHCIHGKANNVRDVEGVDLQEKLENMIVKKLGLKSENKPRLV